MLKFLIVGVVLIFVVNAFISGNHETDRQTLRDHLQANVLADLEKLNDQAVSHLVDEWRAAYPEPSEDNLTELQVMAQRVKNNPSSAAGFTIEARQRDYDQYNNVVTGIGGPMHARAPGLRK